MTSSPRPMPSALSAKMSASVPLATLTAWPPPQEFGEGVLERGDFCAEDIGPAFEYAIYGASDLRLMRAVLRQGRGQRDHAS